MWSPRVPAPPGADPLEASSSLDRFSAVDPSKRPWPELLAAAARVSASGDRNVRRHLVDLVLTVLGRRLVDPKSIDPLPWLSAGDPDLRLLGILVVRAAKAAAPPVFERLRALSTGDPSDEVSGMACLALGDTGGEAAAGPLAQGLSHPSWRVRRRAALAMSELRSPATFDATLRALREDKAFQVRGYAARTLGRLRIESAKSPLELALADPSEFVRALAAEALLTGFSDKAAMRPLLALLDWKVGPLRERFVDGLLTDLTGRAVPMDRATWEKWWAEAEAAFDLPAAARALEKLAGARARREEGDVDGAIALYREIRAAVPGHAGAGRDLAELLNGKAWKMAVAGEDLPAALALARESVEAVPGAQNVDTLVVLLFLTDRREEAEGRLVKAMEGASEADLTLHERRLAEFRAGKVDLR
jgi:HEAT repeat protein